MRACSCSRRGRARRARCPRRSPSSSTQIDGTVVGRSSPAYDAARHLYNERYDALRPLAVVYCETTADVRKTVAWSRRHRIRIAARVGRPQLRRLLVGGRRRDRGRVPHGQGVRPRRAPGGRRGGRAADRRLRRSLAARRHHPGRVVRDRRHRRPGPRRRSRLPLAQARDDERQPPLAHARHRRRPCATCSPSQNADLYWASRGGGGGNFGIATEYRFRTSPISTVTTFTAGWPWAQAQSVIAAWLAWAPHAPDELFSVCNLGSGGGSPTIRVSGQLVGTPAADEHAARTAPRHRRAVVREGQAAPVHRGGAVLGRLRADLRVPPRAVRRAHARDLRGQVGLRTPPAPGRCPAGDRARRRAGARRRLAVARLLRRRRQPRAQGGDRVRPPRLALLPAVPRLLERSRARPRPTWRGCAPSTRRCARTCRARRTSTTSIPTWRDARAPTTGRTSGGWCRSSAATTRRTSSASASRFHYTSEARACSSSCASSARRRTSCRSSASARG